ncbi:hypothetical protein ES705_44446 [subsurface metagenome]
MNINRDPLTELSRSLHIYIDNQVESRLYELFKEATGVSLNEFFDIFFILYSRFFNKSTELIPSEGFILDFEKYFKTVSKKYKQTAYQIVNLFSASIEEHKTTYERQLNSFDLEEYNFQFIKDKPLLEYQKGKFLCLSFAELCFKATTGLYEFMRNQLKSTSVNMELGEILGPTFENYINDLIDKVFPPGLSNRVIRRKSKERQLTDAILDYGNELVLFEFKAELIQKSHIYTNDIEKIKFALKPFISKRKGAVQLDKVIKDFKKGTIALNNIDPKTITKYWPIVVSCIHEVPYYYSLYEFYDSLLKKYKIFQDPQIGPLVIISIREFEMLMELAEKGFNVLEILHQKTSTAQNISFSLWNFLTISKYSKHLKRPEFHTQRLEKLTESLKVRVGLVE